MRRAPDTIRIAGLLGALLCAPAQADTFVRADIITEGQMDCIDESTNTTLPLKIWEQGWTPQD